MNTGAGAGKLEEGAEVRFSLEVLTQEMRLLLVWVNFFVLVWNAPLFEYNPRPLNIRAELQEILRVSRCSSG